ncbi:MAG: MFS transporter [Clostridiaceae bacterium]|jgi:Na+/melibiose symporter-like transporter|nr:MFS transporter [Clostridiaceae bacterium]
MDTQKFRLKKTITISLAFAWISIFNSVYDTLMPVVLTSPLIEGGLGLNYTGNGIVMALDNILGLLLLPLFGWLSDRTKSRMGKRTPYILIGSVLAVVFWVLAGVFLREQFKWLFLVFVGATLALNSAYRPAALSLLPDLTPLKHRRKANAITQIISIIATIIGIVIVTLFTRFGFDIVFYADIAFMVPLIIIFIVTVREKKWTTESPCEKISAEEEALADFSGNRKNLNRNRIFLLSSVFFFYIAFNGLVSSLSNYATRILELDKSSFTIPQLLCLLAASLAAVPVSKLSTKFKRKHLLIAGMVIMLGAFAIAGMQKGLNAAMIISFILAGAGYSVAIVNLYPYMMELSDPLKLGKNTGIFNNAMMIAMVLTPILSGALADRFSLSILFPYCITALVIAAALLFFIKDKPRPKALPTDTSINPLSEGTSQNKI